MTTPVFEVPEVMDPLSQRRIPPVAQRLALVVALAVGLLAWALGASTVLSALVALSLPVVGLPIWAAFVEGRRSAADRLATGLVWSAFGVVCVPLVWIVLTVIEEGASTINGQFLTFSMRGVLSDDQGGLYHALLGTLIITGLSIAMAVPLGIFAAIYLIEYGNGNRISRVVTFLVDVMTGIPSIVAGLFAFALMAVVMGMPVRMGLGGAIALALLMLPTVVRTTEEMLKLVPNELREASYALGVPKWRTILKVVIPTAFGGIVTGIMLAIARVVGETAPLLVAAGFTNVVNTNPADNPMMTLPVFIYTQFTQATDKGYAYAWGGALVLIAFVMLLNLVARIMGKIFAPASTR